MRALLSFNVAPHAENTLSLGVLVEVLPEVAASASPRVTSQLGMRATGVRFGSAASTQFVRFGSFTDV